MNDRKQSLQFYAAFSPKDRPFRLMKLRMKNKYSSRGLQVLQVTF